MKAKSPLVIAGLFGVLASNAWSADNSTKAAPAAEASAAKPVAPAAAPHPASAAPVQAIVENDKSTATQVGSAKKLPPATAEAKAVEAATKEHIQPVHDRYRMETPPPALRPETKPPMPAQGMVWVPGHWIPVKGEWQWTAGHWGIPATPISVWIDAKYDPKSKQWSPGYWQPDGATPEPPEVPAPKEDQTPSEKFF
jgi:hypothetical protein